MRYLTVEVDGRPHVAVAVEDGLRATRGGANVTLSELLGLPAEQRDAALAPDGVLPADARVLAPLRPASIVCIGLNYLDHVRETGAFADPPRYLRAGDVVEVDVEGVGTLTNPVQVL